MSDVQVVKNYMTRQGLQALKDEWLHLLDHERPDVVKIIAWAASNGDRSENADYIYGKRRLREIDRRIHFLGKRIEAAEVVDSRVHQGNDQVFFGAYVTYALSEMIGEAQDLQLHCVQIVGVDEINLPRLEKELGVLRISWISPLAKALLKAREGDVVQVDTPTGLQQIEIIAVEYIK
jgi:transcription elongation factor GreB